VGDPKTPNFIKSLVNYVKNNGTEGDIYDSDSSIYHIDTKKPLGKTEITVDFEGDDPFLDAIGLGDDDKYFLNNISSFGDYDLFDYYNVEDDFKEGYIVYGDLDEENLKKLKYISSVLLPGESFNLDDDKFRVKLSKVLLFFYDSQIENIITEWKEEQEIASKENVVNVVEKQLDEYLNKINFSIYSKFDKITTTITQLVMWWIFLGRPEIDDVAEFFVKILEKNGNSNLGGWDDLRYTGNFEINTERFNDNVSKQLDDIIEIIEEDETINEFVKMTKRISSKFKVGIGYWSPLPKNKKIEYNITGFDRDGNKIDVRLRKMYNNNNYQFRELKLTEQNFYYLLYQPTLFKFDEIY
jgi:hypothetical protein